MPHVGFFVPGIPQPGGSKKAFPIKRKGGVVGVAVTDANPQAKPWKALVAASAPRVEKLMEGPIELTLDFAVPRPKGHYGTGKNASRLKASAPAYPTTKPDVLKLARTVEDALTGVLWRDDAQIVKEVLNKSFGAVPGVSISVWEM